MSEKTRRVRSVGGPARPATVPSWLSHADFSEDERMLYIEAAERSGLEVAHWARQVLNVAAREILAPAEQEPRGPTGASSQNRRSSGHPRRPTRP